VKLVEIAAAAEVAGVNEHVAVGDRDVAVEQMRIGDCNDPHNLESTPTANS
jgi:hypothetical protein